MSQQNAGNILAGIGVDHDKSDLAFRPVVNLIEATEIELLVNQNRARIDGGSNELEPDRLASFPQHSWYPPQERDFSLLGRLGIVDVLAVKTREQEQQWKRERPDSRGDPCPIFEAASSTLGNSTGKIDRNNHQQK
jgi:hypothetical protein